MAGTGHHPLREVTEDTPPDLLEGTMDLLVILPTKKNVQITVNRRTPIMDLLVQVTTANKINPGGHIVQVRNEIGRELQYKPSTPIGVLDTRTIEIVPKHQVNDYIINKKQSAAAKNSTPFEHTFRLQVHLPKNQLYVMRVGPKTLLQDILEEVCQEKNLDIAKYEIRHPINLDEKLSLTNRLGDYGIQQVRVVSRNSRITSSVSSADILALQASSTNGRGSQGYLDSAFNYSRSSVGDSSVSSGSAASARGTSPSRSDDSRSISPVAILPSKIKLRSSVSSASGTSPLPLGTAILKKSISSNPLPTGGFGGVVDGPMKPKKRAPPPPSSAGQPHLTSSHQSLTSSSPPEGLGPGRKKEAPRPTTTAAVPTCSDDHSRHSSASDSSGYHEASASSILSDQQQDLIRTDSRAIAIGRKVGTGSLSSLVTTPPSSKPFGMSGGSSSNLTSGLSISTTSISSTSSSRNKRKAPKPPGAPTLQAPLELELEEEAQISPAAAAPVERRPVEVQVEVHPTLLPASADETEPSSSSSGSTISQRRGRPEGAHALIHGSPALSTSTSMGGSTLTRSGGSGTGSRSSLASVSPSPSSPAGVERRSSPVVSMTSDLSSLTSPPQSPSQGDKHEEASSGSEASYADSGLPATATVTPSPVSLDHHMDAQEQHSDKSLNSSRRSSLHSGDSDHSESWRELLESKVEGQTADKVLESVFSTLPAESARNEEVVAKSNFTATAPSPERLKGEAQASKATATSGVKVEPSQQSEVKSTPASPPPKVQSSAQPISMSPRKTTSDHASSPSSSEDEADAAQRFKVQLAQQSSTSKRPMPKAESFSHTQAEYEGKKRRSHPRIEPTMVRKYTSSTSSSSDDEGGNRRKGQGKHKSAYMQNLSKIVKPPTTTTVAVAVRKKPSASDEPLEKIVKATSLAALPVLAPAVAPPQLLGNDPKLMATFQVELEHQFEQWKEEFIQRHLRSPTASSVESSSTVDPPQNQVGVPVVPEPLAASPSRRSSSSSSDSPEEGEEFDPEKPQAVHSVGRSRTVVEESLEDKSAEQVPAPILGQEGVKVHEANMNGDVKRREKRTPDPVWRYSGPPAINMGTWGERPRRSPIAVKDDEDYIMGMGQQDPKEPKTNVAARIHNFTGVPVNVAVTPKRPGANTSRWSTIEVKSPEPWQSNGNTIPAVLSTWKQATEKAAVTAITVNVTPEKEAVSVSAASTLERPQHRSSSNKPSFTISSASSTLERPVGKRTPSPLFTAVVAAVTPPRAKEVVIESTTSGTKAVTNGGPGVQPAISMEDKKKFFQGTQGDIPAKEVTAPLQRPQSFQFRTQSYADYGKVKEVTLEDTADGPGSRSASSASSSSFGSLESPTPSGITLDEKKRFFQGVRPLDSPTREAPLPAVNMKSSIATIQRVFEQRSPLASESSSRVTTPSVSATPSPHGTLSRKEHIGGQSQSDAMVQQVLRGKGTNIALEAFQRTPSPAQAQELSAGTVRISTAPNIQNHGNKAIIHVGGEPEAGSGTNGNLYRQQLKVNGSESNGHSFKISINGGEKTAAVTRPTSKQPTMVVINGSKPPPPPPDMVLEESKKGPPSKSKIQEMQSLLAQQKLNFVPQSPPAGAGAKIEKRPTTLNGLGKSASVDSNSSGKSNGTATTTNGSDSISDTGSVPATPTSPQEARAGILSAIKQGNFGLKKTRSSMLLN